MGMDFEVYKINKKYDPENKEFKFDIEDLLYLRKPYLLAECCYLVMNGLPKEEYGHFIPVIGPWPFTNDMLKEVLRLALEIESDQKVDWSYDNSMRGEIIDSWQSVIKQTEDDFVMIEWG